MTTRLTRGVFNRRFTIIFSASTVKEVWFVFVQIQVHQRNTMIIGLEKRIEWKRINAYTAEVHPNIKRYGCKLEKLWIKNKMKLIYCNMISVSIQKVKLNIILWKNVKLQNCIIASKSDYCSTLYIRFHNNFVVSIYIK